MGSRVKVTNPANGRSVVVRINDRGPYLKGRGIDLSHAAAKRIGLVSKGVGRVRVAKTNGGPVEPAAGTVTGSIHDWRIRSSRLQRRHHARRRIVSNPIGHWLFSALR